MKYFQKMQATNEVEELYTRFENFFDIEFKFLNLSSSSDYTTPNT